MSDEVKLLPCAHCGDTNPRLMGRQSGFVYCTNDECGAQMKAPEPYDDDVAVKLWNTRAIEATDEVVEKVARAISPHVWRKFDQQNRPLSETDRAAKLAEKKANPNTLIGQSIRHARAAIAAIEATRPTDMEVRDAE